MNHPSRPTVETPAEDQAPDPVLDELIAVLANALDGEPLEDL